MGEARKRAHGVGAQLVDEEVRRVVSRLAPGEKRSVFGVDPRHRRLVVVESFHAKLNVGYDPLINRSGRQPFTYVRAVFNPPLGIGLRATTAGGFDGLLGRAEGEDVPIDEQGFRGVFRVTARDGSRARFLLGPEIIREMMKLNEIYAGVALADELVQIKMSGYQIETELLRSAFADATGLANRIRGSQNSER